MNVSTNREMVKIAIEKSLLKEYSTNNTKRVVFLEDGAEFQLQLFNPYDYTVGAKIFINGKRIENTLVLKPGQRIWLERYLDSPDKFKFSTYTTDDSIEARYATRNNGEIKVEFYKEREAHMTNVFISQNNYKPMKLGGSRIRRPSYYNDNIVCGGYNSYDNGMFSSLSLTSCEFDGNPSLKCCCDIQQLSYNDVETGRVERGSHSNQDLNEVNIDFELYSFATEYIKILPVSMKTVSADDLPKIYCTECGRKIQSKYKFCPNCGTQVQ